MLLRSLAALGVTFACVSAASAQTIYEPAGHVSTAPRYFRAGEPAAMTAAAPEMTSAAEGGALSPYQYLERGTSLQGREYLALPPAQRDDYIWSIVQQKLEEHLDYAFPYETRVRYGTGPYATLGYGAAVQPYAGARRRYRIDTQHLSLNDVYNDEAARMPRYFRKRELMAAGTVRPDGSRTVPADAQPMPMMNGNTAPAQQTTKPATAPKPILIIPKNALPKEQPKPSDKQVAVAK